MKKKIIIEVDTEESDEKISQYFEGILLEAFQKPTSIKVEGAPQ